jgi:hypothetical protein
MLVKKSENTMIYDDNGKQTRKWQIKTTNILKTRRAARVC